MPGRVEVPISPLQEPLPRRNTTSLYDQGFGKNPSAEERSKPKPIEAPLEVRGQSSAAASEEPFGSPESSDPDDLSDILK